jgi:hypothetical protein
VCIAGSQLGPGIADANHWLFAFKKVVRESLVFHPGSVDKSVFSGSTVPLLATEFLFGHEVTWVL